ncbi:phage-related minor tail protein [Sphingomonas sp. BE138]|uniref:tail tape measure protein n=1 Tax=Sphingomonas sp. BE138 TaxID=2817845 RepID=UPI0028606D5C|nr:tail tape measure protein [Sphingomonas sp. BE138]MDR6788922.1 phage-related minor tail protein [Sphingomonas sp. BE138]
MDDEIERLVIGVRADTGGFARDVAAMRATLESGLGNGAERAGRAVETALARAVRTGKLGFDDLKAVALSAMGEIAAAALRQGIGHVLGSGGAAGGGGGLLGAGGLAGLLTGLLGLPGRATGGPVSPGRAYLVGERGPEVFVPTTSGHVAVPGSGGGARDVRVAITINAGTAGAPEAMARSSRQVARAVRAALTEAE